MREPIFRSRSKPVLNAKSSKKFVSKIGRRVEEVGKRAKIKGVH
jgi:hypothetical protein